MLIERSIGRTLAGRLSCLCAYTFSSISFKIANLEATIDASHGGIKQELVKQLWHINKNIQWLAILAPTQRAAPANMTGLIRATEAQLGKLKCLHVLWVEHTHDIGRNEAAKDFAPTERGRVKQKHYRRKTFWDVFSYLFMQNIELWGLLTRSGTTVGGPQVSLRCLTACQMTRRDAEPMVESILPSTLEDIRP